ncbi:MAG: flagellar motor switch phosphatase FliY [Lachnospiraceae bacterium]|nr:flagellar motor switch phosphatase FliY [Lachnospiraceae bacterium]MCI9400213.1 flagellar motor switch phosphatase FliY [Lachnospiraceae bacterium]MCX4375271.1 flagellar motor switch phosphatase FliY [Lachnospiraceae bacterium]
MDGMLSQDEINALLNGVDLSADSDGSAATATAQDGGDDLTDIEKDAIGEVANISMGTSATTLFSLVNRKVNITTPKVEMCRWAEVVRDYERPCVFIQIKYTVGLNGTNILVLKEHDVKVITDLMMGGDGTNIEGELNDLHLSAISEAMNQMMGSSSTSLSSMLGKTIDISPPEASLVDLQTKEPSELSPFLEEKFVKISFRMQIDDLVDSTLMQLYPLEFAKSIYDTFMTQQTGGAEPAPAPTPAPAPAAQDMGMQQPQMDMGMQQQMNMGMPQMQMGMPQMQPQMQMGMPQMQMGMPQQMPMGGMGYGMPNVNIQPAQFQNFAPGQGEMVSAESIGLIKDVPLEVTVELGRTSKSISDILEFAPGTIIELDKIAGEPIDVLVNGKFVAKGEVVVIEESFGVRIMEIVR